MTKLCTLLLAGSGIAAMAFGTAFADERMHEINVRLTDGSIEHISYFGNRPPKVSVGVNADEGIAPIYGDIFASPFSDMKRILAAMDEQEASMMRMAAAPDGGLERVDISKLRKGPNGYTVVSVTFGGRTCTTSLRYFGDSSGQPHVEKTSSGNCSAAQNPGATAIHAVSRHRPPVLPSKLIEANYQRDSKMKTVEKAGLY